MRTKIFIYILLIGLFSFSAYAQKEKPVQITNTVVDEMGNVLPGVAVIVNEGAIETTTDKAGEFNVQVKGKAVFLFELNGYESLILNGAKVQELIGGISLAKANTDKSQQEVNLPYKSVLKRYRTTGNIGVVDVDEALDTDVRLGLSAAIFAKIPGMTGTTNVHGLGGGTIVIDGVVSELSDITLAEIEQITVLKDPISRMIYGADGDKGVIMITTKNGTANKKEMKFRASSSMRDAISTPNFLGSGDYMKTYNQAFLNDGGDINALPYSQDIIDATVAGTDPVRYPDVDYYSSEYLKSQTYSKNVYGEASGGNDKVQYFLNFRWDNSEGWFKKGENEKFNTLRSRGKIKAEVTDWLTVRSEISALININKGPNFGDDTFWKRASTYLPNTYPLLIPKDRVSNFDDLAGERLVDGQYLLGGTSIYQGNLIGDFSKGGDVTRINRYLSFNNGLDFDLKGITKGLKATVQTNFQFFNSYYQTIDNTYAVYEPTKDTNGQIIVDENGQMTVTKRGLDKVTTGQSVNEDNMFFTRKINAYLSLNYDRTFDKHAIAATLVGYGNTFAMNNATQDTKRISFGGNVNYMFNNKYIAEVGGLMQGSKKMNPDDRFGFAPSVGASWIVSNEDFLNDNAVIDYLKLRASYGIIQNDNFKTNLGDYGGYFLYDRIYKSGGNYYFGNNGYSNREMLISNAGNQYTWQQRKELSLGFDAYLFNNKTRLEATYFNSTVEDELVALQNVSATMGGVDVISNYNSYRKTGFDVGIKHAQKIGDLNLNVGLTYMYLDSEVLKNEALVEVDHLNKEGRRTDASYGYTTDGLYQPGDFNADGTLVEGLPVPSFGTVKPGDVKYMDYHEDGVINANDQHEIGFGGNNQYCTANIELRYKNWQLFAQGNAAFGGTGFIGNNYYKFKGNKAKYSEMALLAYTPDAVTGENTNANSIYPRLTLGNGSNNYKKSTFWAYDKDFFKLSYVQAAYNFKFKTGAVVKNMKLYASGSNLLTVAKSKEIKDMMELNAFGAPSTRTYTLGLVANF